MSPIDRRRPVAAGVVAVALALAALVAAPVAADGPDADLAALKFLAGTWRGPAWGGEFTTHYTTPEGGKVLSTSELRKEGKLAFHEFEVFEVADGAVVLTPYPGGQRAATFKLVSIDAKARRATFENPKNDFPTRIEYHRAADDRLVITLSDPHGKSGQEEVFDLKLVTSSRGARAQTRR